MLVSFSKSGDYDSTQYIEKECIFLTEYGDEYCNEMRVNKIGDNDKDDGHAIMSSNAITRISFRD